MIFSVLFVSLISLLAYYQHSKQTLLTSELRELRSQTSATITHYESIIELAGSNLQALSRLLQQKLSQDNDTTSLSLNITQSNDGGWRNNKSDFDGHFQSGIFLPPDVELTPQVKQFYAIALTTFDSFGAAATSHPMLRNIWMLGHDRSEIILRS
ncbi:MAG: hypothetical protein Q9N32_06210 [Gammaproteobacteria bacterium]|nr:hypothetical protein [Gammaproteobacteria bacterium]